MRLGIVGGSSFMSNAHFTDAKATLVSTPYGVVLTHVLHNIVFCQRHHSSPDSQYQPPHLINKRAVIAAFQVLNCDFLLGFGSVGTLDPAVCPVSSVVVPDDYFKLNDDVCTHGNFQDHVIPGLDSDFRQEIISILSPVLPSIVSSDVVYVQTSGPRFETKAEIRFLANCGSVVGMTCADEATICKQLSIPYCIICIVDNLCNGITDKTLSRSDWKNGVDSNNHIIQKVVDTVFDKYLIHDSIPGNSIPGNSVPGKVDKSTVDLVIKPKYIVPIVPEGKVFEQHAIVVHNGVIVDILPSSEVGCKYVSVLEESLPNHVIMPGLVNCHTHLGMSLLRGYADDLGLHKWLTECIWPAEAVMFQDVDKFVKTGCELGLAEMIRSGTTCFGDMYFYPEIAGSIAAAAGVRAVLGPAILDFPTQYASNPQEYFQRLHKALKKFEGHERISCSVIAHAPYTVCDASLVKCGQIALHHDIPFAVHLHETKNETEASSNGLRDSPSCHRSTSKCTPLMNFEKLKLVNDHLVAVHMTQLTKEEISLLAKAKAHVVTCPTSNLKLASGICPVSDLLKAGVNVGIGTDSNSSNNTLNMFAELRLVALLHKVVSDDPTALPASTVLQMATLNGARALRLEHKIGSLELGKQADIIAVDLNSIECTPCYNVISHLAYLENAHSCSDVWISGKRIMKARKLLSLNEKDILDKANIFKAELQEKLKPKTNS